ncbi:NAD(P)-binding protein, partial [Atractiella rhizophila]
MLSTDANALTVAIIGITGAQGGSVYSALRASSKPYKVIGITRNVTGEKAKKLEGEGVVMRAATVAVGNEEGVKKAFEGAEVVFAVTDFWAHTDMEREYNEIKLVVDTAFSIPTLKAFLWSGLTSYAAHTKGKYSKVYHFEAKAKGTQYLFEKSKTRPEVRAVTIEPAAYMQNFLGENLGFRKQEDGSYVCSTGWTADTKLATIDIANDYGIFVQEALEHENEFPDGSIVRAFSEELTLQEMVNQFGQVTGKQTQYRYVPFEDSPAFGKLPKVMQEDFADFYGAVNQVGYYGSKAEDGKSSAFLSRKPKSWKQFVDDNKKALLRE